MKTNLLIIIILLGFVSYGQVGESYPQYPLPTKHPLALSATFGELRNNAFHAGVDIKTGETGKPVYAVADGYVSRVGVSPFGYGKVVYVTHYDGFMSVYAHLQSFNDTISEYVKEKQYSSKSFKQNLFLEKDVIKVKRGDYLGLSGNSGSSGGPHLHYELRDANQHPVDPFLFGMKIDDKTQPTITGLAIYPDKNSTVNGADTTVFFILNYSDGIYSPQNGEIKANGLVSFGISSFDQTAGLNHKYGLESIDLYADNRLIFNICFKEYSYDETRYINSLIDYAKFVKDKKRYVRTEIDEYNILDMYGERHGYITVNEYDRINMKFVVTDKSGNVSILKFTLVGDKPSENFNVTDYNRSYYRIDGKSNSTIFLDGFTAKIPEKAFYKFEYILAQQKYDIKGNFASNCVYALGSELIPVQKPITISIKPNEKYLKSDKLYVVSVSKDGKTTSQGGTIADGTVTTKVRTLGLFALAVDSIAPNVKPLNFSNNENVSNVKTLKIKILDKGTGINKYDIYVNDEWVIGEYDAKNNLLFYNIEEHFKKGKNNVEIVVTDGVNNETRQSYTLTL